MYNIYLISLNPRESEKKTFRFILCEYRLTVYWFVSYAKWTVRIDIHGHISGSSNILHKARTNGPETSQPSILVKVTYIIFVLFVWPLHVYFTLGKCFEEYHR